MARTAITQRSQAARSSVAGILSILISKIALGYPLTAPIASEIGIVSFGVLTSLGMFARNKLLPKIVQWLG